MVRSFRDMGPPDVLFQVKDFPADVAQVTVYDSQTIKLPQGHVFWPREASPGTKPGVPAQILGEWLSTIVQVLFGIR